MHISITRKCQLLVGLFVLLPISSLFAQSSLEDAVSAYHDAEFDQAISLFADVAGDEAQNKGVRKEALQFLGRAYIAKRNEDKARDVLKDLIELEPPIVELDPDVESPPLMKLYYDVRKQQTDSYEVERADPGLQTLAIVDFTNNSLDDRERFDPLRGWICFADGASVEWCNGAQGH